MSINPESLLLEGARRVDEWGLVEKKIPTLRSRVRDGSRQGPVERRRADGRATRGARADRRRAQRAGDHRRVRPRGVRGRQGAVRPAHGGIHHPHRQDVGLADVSPRRRGASTSIATSASRSTRPACSTRRCASSGACSSCMRPTSSAASISGSCWRGSINGRKRREAFTESAAQPGAKAAVFHNLAYALEQQKRVRRSARGARRSREARRRQRRARADVARRREPDGRRPPGGGRGARRRAPAVRRAAADARRGTTTWGSPRRCSATRRARATILREGVASHPHAAVLSNNLAAVLERIGEHEQARIAVEHGMHEDAAIAQLHKNLGDLYYRGGRYDEAFEAYSARRQGESRARRRRLSQARQHPPAPAGARRSGATAGSARWRSTRTTPSSGRTSSP